MPIGLSASFLLGSISDFLLFAFEKSDVSSANYLQSEVDPPRKSFIYIRNNNGPKTELYRPPAKMFFHKDFCPFKRTGLLSIF